MGKTKRASIVAEAWYIIPQNHWHKKARKGFTLRLLGLHRMALVPSMGPKSKDPEHGYLRHQIE
ncbi:MULTISPECIES: hypothetical protein [Pantoea]|uniref:hypothetical protein n=1 Tax=Pantoea TaxID=53335 RepID=UPI001353A8A9|nr:MULTISPECIES: hypothetical protein [Pantoea]MXP61119.1 hypothetical protein [Pantoea sp. Taur]